MRNSILVTVFAIGLAACGRGDDATVQRRIDMVAQAYLPEGIADFEDETLRVETSGLEPLVGAHHVVWVDGGEGPVNAGELEDGKLVVTVPNLSPGWRCFVTEEDDADADTPSSRARLGGAVGGPMHFAERSVFDELEGAGGDCLLSDNEVDLGVEGLPEPPDGLRYTAWAVCPHLQDHHDESAADRESDAADEHHGEMMASEHHGEEEESHHHYFGDDPDADSAEEAIHLGALEFEGLHVSHRERVGGCESVFITLESENGVDEPSPIVLMHGDVSFPEASRENQPHMH